MCSNPFHVTYIYISPPLRFVFHRMGSHGRELRIAVYHHTQSYTTRRTRRAARAERRGGYGDMVSRCLDPRDAFGSPWCFNRERGRVARQERHVTQLSGCKEAELQRQCLRSWLMADPPSRFCIWQYGLDRMTKRGSSWLVTGKLLTYTNAERFLHWVSGGRAQHRQEQYTVDMA